MDLIYPGATTRQPRGRKEEKRERPAGQLLAAEVPSPLGGLRGGRGPEQLTD